MVIHGNHDNNNTIKQPQRTANKDILFAAIQCLQSAKFKT